MRRSLTILSSVLVLGAIGGVVLAGELNPPAGPVASSMKTLAEVEPRTPITALPFTVSSPGSYYLTGDLSVTSGHGIHVNASDVTIDLMGFTITGSGPTESGDGILINVFNSENVTIRNGTVRSFESCITAIGSDNSDGNGYSVENVRVLDVGLYGIDLRGHNNRIRDCFAEQSETPGPFGTYGITIVGGTMSGCRANGFSTGLAAIDGSVMKDCVATNCDTGILCWESVINGCAVHNATTQSIFPLGTNTIVNTHAP